MDDHQPDAEAKMRRRLGLSEGSSSPAVDDPQRLARQAIRSQAAAREYAERHLARAEQAIQDLQAKLHAVRREKAIAIEAARAAQEAQTQAERARRAAEAALINEKSVSETAQREAREARATVQDLRTKLAQAKETVETLRTQLERARQAGIAAEVRPGTPMLTAAMENVGVPGDQPVKRKRGRPPRNRNESAATRPPSKPRKSYPDQAPVQWWTDGWTPRT